MCARIARPIGRLHTFSGDGRQVRFRRTIKPSCRAVLSRLTFNHAYRGLDRFAGRVNSTRTQHERPAPSRRYRARAHHQCYGRGGAHVFTIERVALYLTERRIYILLLEPCNNRIHGGACRETEKHESVRLLRNRVTTGAIGSMPPRKEALNVTPLP